MLQLGSKGQEVKVLQEKLIARGYSVGSYGADGDFGQGTHDAVMKFQRDKGLTPDGIVGPDTMRAIDGSIGTTILRIGDKGSAVRELQTKLIAKGYNVGSYGADGDFGQGTHDAVMKFQKDNRLDADGVVGPATWSILNGFSNGSLLKKGDRGAEVKKLQEKLIARGYSVGSYGADGDFGQGTHDAVMKFQRDNGLSVDGVVGPATWEVLNGINGNLVLRKGDKGPEVKSLQQKLITRGYSVGSYGADGDFGQGTHDAVMKFQRDNGLEADGVAGPKTFYALNANPSGTLLRLGSKGEEVRNLQERLIARGYSVGAYGADGDFGQGTHDAVVKFQRENGLDADGVVGPATWAALGTNDTLLRLGSKGAEVRRLQEKLISKGYSVGSAGADGDFGQGTHDAVIKFQRDNGLSADGVVGPATWSALNGFGDWNPGIGGSAGVKKFLNAAKSQLGVQEVPINITPYGAWYGFNGVAWCAIFVSWCANQGGILGNLVPKFHWCADGVNWFKARGRYMTRSAGTPQPGDVIFFYTSKDAFYHVGIVDYVANGKVYTVEGNTDDAVRVRSYSLTDSKIHGYGRNGGPIDGGVVDGDYDNNENYHRILKLQTPHMKGADVKKIQQHLKNIGYRGTTVDGVFGANTRENLKDFQMFNGMLITGEVDKKMWDVIMSAKHIISRNEFFNLGNDLSKHLGFLHFEDLYKDSRYIYSLVPVPGIYKVKRTMQLGVHFPALVEENIQLYSNNGNVMFTHTAPNGLEIEYDAATNKFIPAFKLFNGSVYLKKTGVNKFTIEFYKCYEESDGIKKIGAVIFEITYNPAPPLGVPSNAIFAPSTNQSFEKIMTMVDRWIQGATDILNDPRVILAIIAAAVIPGPLDDAAVIAYISSIIGKTGSFAY